MKKHYANLKARIKIYLLNYFHACCVELLEIFNVM